MTRWEYKSCHLAEDSLNMLGKEGWEAFAVCPPPTNRVWLKRPLPEGLAALKREKGLRLSNS